MNTTKEAKMTRLEETARTLGRRGTDYHGFLNFLRSTGYRLTSTRGSDLRKAYYQGRSEFEADA